MAVLALISPPAAKKGTSFTTHISAQKYALCDHIVLMYFALL